MMRGLEVANISFDKFEVFSVGDGAVPVHICNGKYLIDSIARDSHSKERKSSAK